jgi:AraC-like DNA-binding protein
MRCYTHESLFHSGSIELKMLHCRNPADHVGFEDEYEASRISLVRSGVFARVIRGRSLLADPTQVLFVNRGDVHRFVHPLEGGDSCTILEPAPGTLLEIQWHFDRTAQRFPVDQQCSPVCLARVHYELLRLVARGNVGDDLASEELCLNLCSDLVQLAYHNRPAPRTVSGWRAAAAHRRMVERVRLALNAHVRRPPGLSDLAGMVNCSAFHLSRVFRRNVGMTIRAYLAQLRMAAAAQRLLDGADDLASLALELGYYDQSHFTNAFVSTWGVSPSRFRAGWWPGRRAARRANVSKMLRDRLT